MNSDNLLYNSYVWCGLYIVYKHIMISIIISYLDQKHVSQISNDIHVYFSFIHSWKLRLTEPNHIQRNWCAIDSFKTNGLKFTRNEQCKAPAVMRQGPQLAIPWVSTSHVFFLQFHISDFHRFSKQCPILHRLTQGVKSLRWPARACFKATLLLGLVWPEKS